MQVPATKSQPNVISGVVSGWVANALLIASGFVMPRLIDDRLGQEALGVWDFGWAVVSYFSLLQGGLVSSINRYVARHRAVGDWHNLNVAVSSVNVLLKSVALVIALLSVALAGFLPSAMEARLGDLAGETRWLLLLLGLTSAVQIQGAIYGGVLTGCHKWTTHNMLKSLAALIIVAAGAAVLYAGGGIVALSAVVLSSELVLRAAQNIAAKRACPQLQVSLRHFSKSVAFQMAHFGSKTYLTVISQMLVNQTANIIVASSFGVAALAVFARPRSIIRAFTTTIDSGAAMVVPLIGSLELDKQLTETRRVAIASARYATFACIPAMLFMVTLGDDVMRLWMGENYADPVLISIFAVCGLIDASFLPLNKTLMGLNRHGTFALLSFAASCTSVVLVVGAAYLFHSGMHTVSLLVVLPGTLANAVALPLITARVLSIRTFSLYREILLQPILCCILCGLALASCAVFIQGAPAPRVAAGIAGAFLTCGYFYWRYAFPPDLRRSIAGRLGISAASGR